MTQTTSQILAKRQHEAVHKPLKNHSYLKQVIVHGDCQPIKIVPALLKLKSRGLGNLMQRLRLHGKDKWPDTKNKKARFM